MTEYKSKYLNYKNEYLNLKYGNTTGGMLLEEEEALIDKGEPELDVQEEVIVPEETVQLEKREQKLLKYVEMFRYQLKECQSFQRQVESDIRTFNEDKKVKNFLKRKLNAVKKQIKLMEKAIQYAGNFKLTYYITTQIHYLILENDIVRMEDKIMKKWDKQSRTRIY